MASRSPRLTLKLRFAFLWIPILVVATSLAWVLSELEERSPESILKNAEAQTQAACAELRLRFSNAQRDHVFQPADREKFQSALLEIVLDHYSGIEGGFFSDANGFSSYAFPTYDGNGIKRDVPEAEKPALQKLIASSISGATAVTKTHRGRRETLISTACPVDISNSVSPASSSLAVWTLTRLNAALTAEVRNFATVLVSAILLLLGSAAATTWLVTSFFRGQTNAAAQDAKKKERLATLGRIAAEMAHEIRNPLATLRLKFENAMVEPATRFPKAAPEMTEQLDRIQTLLDKALAQTKPLELKIVAVSLNAFFESELQLSRTRALARGIQIRVESREPAWTFDRFQIARALENLVTNALAFTSDGGKIEILSERIGHTLRMSVRDFGPGFQSVEREGGFGFGLSVVRSIVEAHGGELTLDQRRNDGTKFTMEIPWHAI